MISKPDSRRGDCRPTVASLGFLDLSLFLSVPAQGCCCLLLQRRMLQVSACEYEPACAPCSSPPQPPGLPRAQTWLCPCSGPISEGCFGAGHGPGHSGAQGSNLSLATNSVRPWASHLIPLGLASSSVRMRRKTTNRCLVE